MAADVWFLCLDGSCVFGDEETDSLSLLLLSKSNPELLEEIFPCELKRAVVRGNSTGD